jgi:hypothetical protein
MLELNAFRRLLGNAGNTLSDDQVEAVRSQMYVLARETVRQFVRGRRERLAAKSAYAQLPEDVRIDVEERAAVLEFDAALPRDAAERAALGENFRQRLQKL